MAAEGRVRCTYDLPIPTKLRLEDLKTAMRRRGLGAVSETQILTAMIETADADRVAKMLKIAAGNQASLEELSRQPRQPRQPKK